MNTVELFEILNTHEKFMILCRRSITDRSRLRPLTRRANALREKHEATGASTHTKRNSTPILAAFRRDKDMTGGQVWQKKRFSDSRRVPYPTGNQKTFPSRLEDWVGAFLLLNCENL